MLPPTGIAIGLFVAGCSGPTASEPPAPAATATAPSTQSPEPPSASTGTDASFADLEGARGARLGVFAVDTGTGRTVEHRADDRFGFASTAKAFAAAVVLDRTTGEELDAKVPVEAADLVEYSPVTEDLAGTTISLREASEAAVTVSDNTAMNLLLKHVGGPQGLQDALVEVGDTTTDPERYEPELNDVVPGSGDPADTSTPRAMATTLRAFAVDDALAADDREQLVQWLLASTTGDDLVRAGVPDGWLVGDKTGSPAGYGARNDIAVVWPDGDRDDDPWVIALMTDTQDPDAEPDDALLAEATEVVVTRLGGGG